MTFSSISAFEVSKVFCGIGASGQYVNVSIIGALDDIFGNRALSGPNHAPLDYEAYTPTAAGGEVLCNDGVETFLYSDYNVTDESSQPNNGSDHRSVLYNVDPSACGHWTTNSTTNSSRVDITLKLQVNPYIAWEVFFVSCEYVNYFAAERFDDAAEDGVIVEGEASATEFGDLKLDFTVAKCMANDLTCGRTVADATDLQTGDFILIKAGSADPNIVDTFDVTLKNCWATTDGSGADNSPPNRADIIRNKCADDISWTPDSLSYNDSVGENDKMVFRSFQFVTPTVGVRDKIYFFCDVQLCLRTERSSSYCSAQTQCPAPGSVASSRKRRSIESPDESTSSDFDGKHKKRSIKMAQIQQALLGFHGRERKSLDRRMLIGPISVTMPKRNRCTDPAMVPEMDSLTCSMGHFVGSECRFQCREGYIANVESITCKDSETDSVSPLIRFGVERPIWQPGEPLVCKPITKIRARGSLRMTKLKFDESLNYRTSPQFRNAALEMTQVIRALIQFTLKRDTVLVDRISIEVTGFRPGSVIVDYTIFIEGDKTGITEALNPENMKESIQAFATAMDDSLGIDPDDFFFEKEKIMTGRIVNAEPCANALTNDCHSDAECYSEREGNYSCQCRSGFADITDPTLPKGRMCVREHLDGKALWLGIIVAFLILVAVGCAVATAREMRSGRKPDRVVIVIDQA